MIDYLLDDAENEKWVFDVSDFYRDS
jgi:hypothetical protein